MRRRRHYASGTANASDSIYTGVEQSPPGMSPPQGAFPTPNYLGSQYAPQAAPSPTPAAQAGAPQVAPSLANAAPGARAPAQGGPVSAVSAAPGPLSAGPVGSSPPPNAERPGQMTFKRGTARVPGRGDPRVDKIPAVLAPGEAVLNKPAADAIGRARIASANRAGVRAMGGVSGMEAAMNAHADQCHPVGRR